MQQLLKNSFIFCVLLNAQKNSCDFPVQQHAIPAGPQLPLTTPRLILRDFIQEDIPAIIAIANHSEFSGYLRFHPEKISQDVTCYIEEAIEAKYENGILKLYLPKKEEVKVTPKQITIA